MVNKKIPAVLYLDRNNLTFFPQEGTQLTFTYPVDNVKALEILNEDNFVNEISAFIQSNKIVPAELMIILSADLVYEKDFTFEIESTADKKTTVQSVPVEERTNQIQNFLDLVPFEEIASKTYKIGKSVKVVATNKNLYEIIVKLLNKLGFIVLGVVPAILLPADLLAAGQMNQENAKNILKKIDFVNQFSLLEENSYALSRAALAPPKITMTTKLTSKREYALIGVFVLLISVLGVVVYANFYNPAKDRKIASISRKNKMTTVPLVQSTPTLIPSASPAAELRKDFLKMQISGGTNSQVNLLKQDLASLGYANIVAIPNNIPTSGRATVIFSTTLTTSAKELILQDLKRSLLNVTAQDATSSPAADVIVNL